MEITNAIYNETNETNENNENNILEVMHVAASDLLTMLNNIRILKQLVAKDIEKLDNNYFVEKTDAFEKFNEIFDNDALNDLTSVIDTFCENVKEELETKCSNHEYIDDYVDSGFDKVIQICYCKKCLLSKR